MIDGLQMVSMYLKRLDYYVRPAYAQIGCAHTIDLGRLLYAVQVQN